MESANFFTYSVDRVADYFLTTNVMNIILGQNVLINNKIITSST